MVRAIDEDPVGPPFDRISPKVIFWSRTPHDSAAGDGVQIINPLGLATVASYCAFSDIGIPIPPETQHLQ
jgi:hypothetical protein